MLGLVLVLAALCPRGGHAQADAFQTELRAAATLHLASQATAEVEMPRASADAALAARPFSSRAPGATMMIVGGAAIVAGILVGGDGGTVLILGGVAVGAYGVYLYTR